MVVWKYKLGEGNISCKSSLGCYTLSNVTVVDEPITCVTISLNITMNITIIRSMNISMIIMTIYQEECDYHGYDHQISQWI